MSGPDSEDVTGSLPASDVSSPFIFPLIPGFQLRRLIGEGGMAQVFEAYEVSMHRPVALKVLAAGHSATRFENEAWMAGRLSHPNIVKVYGQGHSGGMWWISMELVDGPSLHAEIRRLRQQYRGKGEKDTSRAEIVEHLVKLFVGVTDALSYVHQQGLVHRDIKPLNLLIGAGGSRLMLTDFGIARDVDASRVTRAGDLLGSVHYMSPEQVAAHRVGIDHRTDIWSLGVSLYEAVTLELPFDSDTTEGYMSALLTRTPAPPRSKTAVVSRDLETVLLKCLEKDPANRFTTASDLRDDLERVVAGRPVLARRQGPARRAAQLLKRVRTMVAAVVVSASALAAGAWWWYGSVQRGQAEVRSRWALEEAIKRNLAPQEVAPDWHTLEAALGSAIKRDPAGELSVLAQRASCEVRVKTWPTFVSSRMAAVSGEVEWSRRRWPVLDDLPPFACDISFDVSLDNAAWSRKGFFFPRPFILWDGQSRVPDDLASPVDPRFNPGSGFPVRTSPDMQAGVHHLKIRGIVRVLDPSTLPRLTPRLLKRAIAGFANDAELDALHKGLERAVIRSAETRPLGSYPFTVFGDFPADFPNAVMPRPGDPSVPAAFEVQKILIERWARGPEALRMRLTGTFGDSPALPVAAEAELRLQGVGDPLRFQVAFAGRTSWIQTRSAAVSAHEIVAWLTVRSNNGRDLPLVAVPQSVGDGEYAGRLVLHPSRDAARRTGAMERYLDLSFEQAVSVTVRTIK